MRDLHEIADPPRQISDFALPDGLWRVDPQRSELGFAVRELWGLRAVHGAFGEYDGLLKVQADEAAGELTIEAASLDTGNRRRDSQLRSAAFFDVERHPRIVFTGTTATAGDGWLTVAGELVIGSSHVRLEIPVDVEQRGGDTLRIRGGTTIAREDAGLTWNVLGMIGGEAVLHADLALERA